MFISAAEEVSGEVCHWWGERGGDIGCEKQVRGSLLSSLFQGGVDRSVVWPADGWSQ